FTLLPAADSSLPTPPVSTPQFIQAIATFLETKSLVLVTNHNQILNILTTEQQAQLSQRIIWEVANYGRYQHLRQSPYRVFSRLRMASRESSVLPPVRVFQWLMAWVQAKPIAIAANLFQEAALVPVHQASQNRPPLAEISGLQVLLSGLSGVFSTPLLPPSASAKLISPLPFSRSLLPSLHAASGGALALPWNGPTALPASYPPTSDFVALPEALTAGKPSISAAERKLSEKQFWDLIETQASFAGYVPSPSEKILRWIDKFFLWLEDFFSSLWREIWKPEGILVRLKKWLASIYNRRSMD
ncbi:MAG: hypothetical protein WCA35_18695, partial [Kovacikia sp.]